MISILIPTYNYNVYPLVHEMHKQASKSGIDFEILVYDDASTQDFDLKKLFNKLDGVSYKYFSKNLGRVPMLQQLINDAKYEMLLTMDADVFPKDRFYFRKLIDEIDKVDADLYYGGTSVPEQAPDKDKILRWKFGKERESPSLSYRKVHPYNTIVCQSTVVKKEVFLLFLDKLLLAKDYYGLDIYYSYLLKKASKKVHHYNNMVTHLGFDSNKDFIEKSKIAINTYHYLYSNRLVDQKHIKLINFTEKYAPLGLCLALKPIKLLFTKFIEKNLQSTNPSLFLLDIYKLIYYCSIR